jgi:hypothetical protein
MPDDGRGASMQIRGRDLLNGVPKETEISQAQIAEALAEPVQQICEAVMTALEATPPDLAADIVDRGVMLTGGGALLGDLDLALREQTGLAVSIADESLNCVALGTGKALEYEKQLRHAIDYDSCAPPFEPRPRAPARLPWQKDRPWPGTDHSATTTRPLRRLLGVLCLCLAGDLPDLAHRQPAGRAVSRAGHRRGGAR